MTTKNDFVTNLKHLRDKNLDAYLFKFLNPSEQLSVKHIFKDYHVYESDTSAEYKRLYVSLEPVIPDFQIVTLKAPYQSNDISHRDVLGALMSLGVKREIFGDITLTSDAIYIQVDQKMVEYVKSLTQVKRDSIYLIESTDKPETEPTNETVIQLSLDSLRIDAIIAKAFHINREDVKILVLQDRVKINFKPIKKHTILCDLYDIISVRGFGRIKILEFMGQSKKQKTRIKCEILR